MKKNCFKPTQYRPNNIPFSAQWLGGTGAGSWFHLNLISDDQYEITRFSPSGEIECKSVFTVDDSSFDIHKYYEFTYLSHCAKCTVLQGEDVYEFIVNGE